VIGHVSTVSQELQRRSKGTIQTMRFAVHRIRGPAWDFQRSMREQDDWNRHAEFMVALAEGGFVVLGGPLGDEDAVLLIVDAPDAPTVHATLAPDPWAISGILRVASVELWTILLTAPIES
jgi:uncharacterized protein YciI